VRCPMAARSLLRWGLNVLDIVHSCGVFFRKFGWVRGHPVEGRGSLAEPDLGCFWARGFKALAFWDENGVRGLPGHGGAVEPPWWGGRLSFPTLVASEKRARRWLISIGRSPTRSRSRCCC
jgi:hypothetical protein